MGNQLEKKMENEMETGIYRGLWGLGFPKIGGTILGVPIIRIIIYWGLYWGPPIYGNYRLGSEVLGFGVYLESLVHVKHVRLIALSFLCPH